ncbi:YopX family protein [Mycolicibacterium parafortuitum]|uniref:YopX protein domain-containing protein n=1 Tax=Mycolicibacterium parafortuitum TaxID=39692 RepID=A0A375YRG0_MYCPF|nr:YopX family protein [Mycolicibacterium parafortuitum]ORB29501.1 hypothetical protein BST38_14800 [Mycolicibacterium parafortuitum]SRX83683.1 hypothetical protein MPP7335_05464 [Mycolicibacterium parafortuitum]
MSRTIKFRAWDGTKMQTVASIDWDWEDEGSIESLCALSGFFVDGSPLRFYTDHADKPMLMQYTGVRDKHGLEIYEGDIVHSETSPLWLRVEWFDSAFSLVPVRSSSLATAVKWRMNTNRMKVMSIHAMICSKEAKDLYPLEVVGNIYENPELLETSPAAS